MTTLLGAWRIDGPPPLPPPFGLLQAAAAPAAGVRFVVAVDGAVVDESELPEGFDLGVPLGRERWLSGVELWPYPADLPFGWDACGAPADKPFGESIAPPSFAALTVGEAITCTSQQIPDQAEFKARATRVLAAVEGYAVEKQLMTGDVFNTQPFLADGNGQFPNGNTATSPSDALQLLEEQIAETGRLGLVHCSPMFATALLNYGLAISDKTGVIRSINGTPVIPGFGYAGGSVPNAHAAPGPRQEWVYATGPIDILRSDIFTTPDTLAEALDRGTGVAGATNGRSNTITYRAERYYVAYWDTALQAAVLADRCMTTCGIAS